jgi:hypothetical protein
MLLIDSSRDSFKACNKHSLFACRPAHNPFAPLRTEYGLGPSRLFYLYEKSATQRAMVIAATPGANRFRLYRLRICAALRILLSCRKLLLIRFVLRLPGKSVNRSLAPPTSLAARKPPKRHSSLNIFLIRLRRYPVKTYLLKVIRLKSSRPKYSLRSIHPFIPA